MLEISPARALPPVISVTELNRYARELIERNLPLTWVAGEISNCKRYDSGHCYFTLKDAQAQVDCVMFRNRFQLLGWAPQDGMRVEVRALPTLYEARGKYQLNVDTMRRGGLGALYEAFERLKAKLEREGLFDPARKRPVPRFPRAIGVVTSLQAAALRDVLTTLRRRMPRLPVVIYPAPVQGPGAAERIAAAIGIASARGDCDVLLVCRGGGSIEDLWAFNEEVVARAILTCAIPVIAGVGHETDSTIADFVADVRAPTPTAAAALACPSCADLVTLLARQARVLQRVTRRGLEDRMQRLDYLTRRLVHPGERIRHQAGELKHLASRLTAVWQHRLEDAQWETRDLGTKLREAARRGLESAQALVVRLDASLRHLNPRSVLERGYSITESPGGIVRDGSKLAVGEDVTITFARGWAGAQVRRTGSDGGK
jgi:exodeoxyribonuclease VII large subunit